MSLIRTLTPLWAGLLSILLASGALPDGITLQAQPGAGNDDVVLQWTGGTPSYFVYSSANPASILLPANLRVVVNGETWTDLSVVLPPGTARYYNVVTTPANCGDGTVDATEGCDDGNIWSGDGCSQACAVEPGYTCTGAPSTCMPCTPTTCAAERVNCGSISDGCGGALNCGTCVVPQYCGGGGIPNVCGGNCTPKTCSQISAECGSYSDGCVGTIDCGTCPPGQTCLGIPGRCING